MFPRNITVLAILCLFVASVLGARSRRSMYYQGPPAPLNHDGTVANTPEVQNAAAVQKAAFAAEFNRLQEAERLAAAHPDFTSPSYSKGGWVQGNQFGHNQGIGMAYNAIPKVYNPAPLNQDGTVALTTEVQQAKAAHQAAFSAEFQRYQEAARQAAAHPDFTSPSYSKGSWDQGNQFGNNQGKTYNNIQQGYLPAPLNQDGTVSLTPEVQQAKAAHQAAIFAEFQRYQEAARQAAAHPDFTSPSYSKGGQDQENQFGYNQGKVNNNIPQVYIPAPLNADGTVALTPEVQQAKAAHQAALSAESQRYQEASRLAAAHPDLTSPWKSYGTPSPQYNLNQHSTQGHGTQQPSYNYNSAARIPAPLNYDGSVAQTDEYKAIAAAHQAEHAKAVQNVKYQNTLSQYKHNPSYNNNYW